MDDLDEGRTRTGYSVLEEAIQGTAEKNFMTVAEACEALLLALANGLLTTTHRIYSEDLGGIIVWEDHKPRYWCRVWDDESQFPPHEGIFIYTSALSMWWARGCPTERRRALVPPPEDPPAEAVGRRGRPQGSGSFDAADAPLIEEMRAAIQSKPDLSLRQAAQRVAPRAKGNSTEESKVKRLCQRYSDKYPY